MTHDLGILLVRIIIGLGIAAHGSQKLFGWFGGHGLQGTAGWLESMGYRPGRFFALLAGGGEFFGGLLTLLGLFGPIGPALIIATMVVAIVTVHIKNGFFAANNGYELPLMFMAGALAAAFTSSSALTLDSVLGISFLHSANATWIVIGLAVLAGVGSYLGRRAPQAQSI